MFLADQHLVPDEVYSPPSPPLHVLTAAMTGRARADYPERALTMIVPFAAGGAIDIIARVFSEPLSKALRQPIVIENRPGPEAISALPLLPAPSLMDTRS